MPAFAHPRERARRWETVGMGGGGKTPFGGGGKPQSLGGGLRAEEPGIREFAPLLSPAAGGVLEALAQRAQALTRRHFGRTIALYAPLYLSNYCYSGCAYCGFASNRETARHK